MTINYARDNNHNKIGVVVANGVLIGWSLCSRKDKWNNKLGLLIAKNRAVSPLKNNIPDKIFPVFVKTIRDEIRREK